MNPAPRAIAVDLDGTLVATDLLWESAFRFVSRNPLRLIMLLMWMAAGKARLKTELAARVPLDAAILPYRPAVVERLSELRNGGTSLVLATAAARPYAEGVAAHLGVFDAVVATEDVGPNLSGRFKARALETHFNGAEWGYIGDSAVDLPVWARASAAITVALPGSTRRRLNELGTPVEHMELPHRNVVTLWVRQLRLHQWAKNVLIFIPLATAHLFLDPTAIRQSILAFISFSLVASAVYIANDLFDLDSDRRHAKKRRRPLAAGDIPIPLGIAVGALLVVVSFGTALWVGPLFLLALGMYLAVTLLYTSLLKRKPIADVVTLALLYTWRIIAGCAAIGVAPSIWLLAFSVFIFFSLAVMKRCAELTNHVGRAHGRSYTQEDLPLLIPLGVSSGIVAALVVVLYLESDEVRALYTLPAALWVAVPLLVFWIARAWLITTRGGMHDDPIIFAIKDRVSLTTLAFMSFAALVAAFIEI